MIAASSPLSCNEDARSKSDWSFDNTLEEGDNWTAFDSSSFKESIKKRRKRKKAPNPFQTNVNSSNHSDDPSVTPTWMKQPVNSDASWMPIAPPKDESKEERITPDEGGSAQLEKRPSRGRVKVEQTTIVANDSSSEISRRQDAHSTSDATISNFIRRRGRSTSRGRKQEDAKSSSSSSSRRRSISRGRRNPEENITEVETEARQPSETRDRERSSSVSRDRGRSSSKKPPSRNRGRSSSRRPPCPQHNNETTPVTRASSRGRRRQPERSRGRSSSRTPQRDGPGIPRSQTPVTRQRSLSRSSRRSDRPMRPPRTPQPGRPPRATRDVNDDASNSGRTIGSATIGNVTIGSASIGRETIGSGTVRSGLTSDTNIGRDISFGTTQRVIPHSPRSVSSSSRKEGGLMEKLFGDQRSPEFRKSSRTAVSSTSESGTLVLPERIHPRILLTATVYHNTATDLWITTINTNQKGVSRNPTIAAKHLKAFSFRSEKEARESAIANAPPKMLPFKEHDTCYVCDAKFAVFRRASHCRNCGVCICNACTVSWSSKMLPETYNLKKEKTVNICATCERLSLLFKDALFRGDYEAMITLYGTGNINLRNPFPLPKNDRKGELIYPIHCAAESGKLQMIKWLMEEHYCPIKRISNGSSGNSRRKCADVPIVTSKGRSMLEIALENCDVDILRYLVIERNASLHEIKDLSMTLRALEAALCQVPKRNLHLRTIETTTRWADSSYDNGSSISGSEVEKNYNDDYDYSTVASTQSNNEIVDTCIICYDNAIDCVITPCGHQICCMQCSESITTCPVCSVNCKFIRVFKP